MNFGLIFLQFMPLLLYIGVERWKGFQAGIIAAIVGAMAMLVVNYLALGSVDLFTLGECSLILLLGVISLQMKNDRLFKFQPTVVAVIFVLVFLAFELKGTPLLVRYIPQIERLIGAGDPTPQAQAILDNMHTPQYRALMAKLSRAMIFLFAAHGAIMAYAALRLSTSKWFLWRLAIYPGLLVVVMIVGATSR